MKPKGMKTKKRKMDLDAFIEEELNNLPTKGGKKPMMIKKPAIN